MDGEKIVSISTYVYGGLNILLDLQIRRRSHILTYINIRTQEANVRATMYKPNNLIAPEDRR